MLHKIITTGKGKEQMVHLKVVLMKNALQCKPTFTKNNYWQKWSITVLLQYCKKKKYCSYLVQHFKDSSSARQRD